MSICVSVQATPRDRASWLDLAREVEAAGFAALYVADHPGLVPSPFVALAAAAGATERIQLGTCVLNAGVWEPVDLASAVATLDVVCGGRALLGVGAGHTPDEWTSTGRPFPSAGSRVARMIELVDATRVLLDGEVVTREGDHFTLVEAHLEAPRPVAAPIPLMIGGNGTRVLRFAAEQADIVGLTGLGRTLEDGHNHEVTWSPGDVRRTCDLIRSSAVRAGNDPVLEALVQHVEITDDARGAAGRLAEHIPSASVDDLLRAPFVWIGTLDQIADRLVAHASELGISRYVVREPAFDDARRVMKVLG